MGCEEIGGHEGRWSRVKDLLRSVWDLDDFSPGGNRKPGMFSRPEFALYRLHRYHRPLSVRQILRPQGESQGHSASQALASRSRPVPSVMETPFGSRGRPRVS